MGVTTQDKVFKRIKITGPKNRLTLPDRSKVASGRDRNYRHNADKIIVSTDKGRIDTTDLQFKSDGNAGLIYNLKGTNSKGKWVQVKLEDMSKPVDSLGVIFRRKAIK